MDTTLPPSMFWSLFQQHYPVIEDDDKTDDEQEDVPEILYWRESMREDIPFLLRMFRTPQTITMFGTVDVEYQLELAHTALTQINAEGSIVSYIALFEYPNIPAVPSFGWLEWIKNLYGIDFAGERNTLFIHLLLWKKRYTHEFLLPLLKAVFLNHVYIKQIILVLPPLVALPDVMEEYFLVENPLDPSRSQAGTNTLQRLAICPRHSIVPRFMLRKAVESDNDDLAPIFNKITKRFVQKYGKYYIAEIIAHPTEGRECIVGEKDQLAVGMMCLNRDINLDVLNENFELGPFNGLHKWDEEDFIPFAQSSTDDSRENLRLTAVSDVDDIEPFSASKASEAGNLKDGELKAKHSRTEVEEASSSVYSSSEDFYLESMEETTLVKDRYFEEADDEGIQDSSVDFDYSPMTARHRNTLVDVAVETRFQFPKTPSPSAQAPEEQEVPEYFGGSNAFAIEMYGLRDDLDERLAFDFLEAAFDCFPDVDYALLTTKPDHPIHPLLGNFVRVTPKPDQTFPHELFVAHRSSVLGAIRVRHGLRPDICHVKALVVGLPNEDSLVALFMDAVVDVESEHRAFVLTVESVVVGVAVISPVDDLIYLRSHYDLDALADLELHKDGTHAALQHFVMCPPFEAHTRFFLREIQRLSDVGCLYHRQPARRPKPEVRQVVVAMSKMLPVRPRRGIQYVLDLIDPVNRPHEQVLATDKPYALYFINKRFTGVHRRHVTLRIVVVGASDTAIAFLETLTLGPMSAYLLFHNITLVSVHGLPDEYPDKSACSMMIPYRGRYNSRYLARLQLRVHVNIIYGALTAIHRTRKLILLSSEQTVAYDHLVLCCGKQFQRPTPLRRVKRERQRGRCFRDRKRAPDEDAPDEPHNVFLVNTPLDAANALTMLQSLMQDLGEKGVGAGGVGGAGVLSDAGDPLSGERTFRGTDIDDEHDNDPHPSVIVYGHCIEALACIATLLASNIPSRFLKVVEAFPTLPSVSCFNDAEVDDAVMSEMKDLGIKIHSYCTFNDWKYDEFEKKVTQVSFESRTEMVTIDCIAMFCFDEKKVSTRTFLALNRASIVYDGHLVINNKFRTNDPYIWAGGPMTKYARRYYADNFRHCFYNSVEVGTAMAYELLKEIDVDLEYALRRKRVFRKPKEMDKANPEMACYKVPKYLQPLITCCVLPGGYNYLNVVAPGPQIPLEVAMCQDSYGQVLVTGDCKSDQGYFRLHFNANNIIESITCYTRANFAVQNIIQLYGKHERVLNNVMERFELGYILDFYDYFDEPWACIIFHDRFNWLEVFIQEYLSNWPLFGNGSVMSEIAKILSSTEDKKVIDQRMAAVEQVYTGSKVEKLIAAEVMKFIHRNSDMLTMYAHPMKVREILRGAHHSSFHRVPRWKYSHI